MAFQQNKLFTPKLKYPCYAYSFNLSQYDDTLYARHNIQLPNKLANATIKRKVEYLAGRLCAKKIFVEMGIEYFDLGSDKNRAPIWPDNIVGSITHTNGIAMVICGYREDTLGLGIDIEQTIKNSASKTLILAQNEYNIFDQLNAITKHGLTLIFSAKESIFKALYPSVNKSFGFHCARLIHFNAKTLTFQITENLSEKVPVNTTITVFYQLRNALILTECEFKKI